MAPAANLPEIDMGMTQQADIQQSYWIMFDKMKDDFVHKKDLEQILKSALVNGGIQGNSGGAIVVAGATIDSAVTDVFAQALAKTYSKLAKTGGAVREEAVGGLEALTS